MLQVQAPNHLMDGSCGQVKKDRPFIHKKNVDIEATLQGTNISHLGKRKIIFKIQFLGDMLVPWRVSFRTMLTRSSLKWKITFCMAGVDVAN